MLWSYCGVMIPWLVGSDVSEEHTAAIFVFQVIGVKMLLSNIGTINIFIPPTSILKKENPCSTETLIRSKHWNTCYRTGQTLLSSVQNCHLFKIEIRQVLRDSVTNLYFSQKARESLAICETGRFCKHTLPYGVSPAPKNRGVEAYRGGGVKSPRHPQCLIQLSGQFHVPVP
jgi:hypothetical protein